MGKTARQLFSGNAANNTLRAYDGDDTLYGGDGDDLLYGYNDNDTLTGGNGADYLIGGNGADTFVFDAATAFDAVDTVTNFSTAQGDALDLSDLLSAYDPLNDAITDFVEITDSGSDSVVKVDTTGTATFGAGTQVATLTGVTGLTDEAALETAGNLFAA